MTPFSEEEKNRMSEITRKLASEIVEDIRKDGPNLSILRIADRLNAILDRNPQKVATIGIATFLAATLDGYLRDRK